MNRLYVLIGSSGTGKTTVLNALVDKEHTLVSHTSRKPREGEVEGVDYYYRTKDEMLRLKKQNAFFEFITFNNNYYGYTKKELKDKLTSHSSVCIATASGLESFLKSPELAKVVTPIFLFADKDKIIKNLKKRGGQVEVDKRIKLYDQENQDNLELYHKCSNGVLVDTTNLNQQELINKIGSLMDINQ